MQGDGYQSQGYNPLMQSRVSFSVNRECPSRMLPLFKKKENGSIKEAIDWTRPMA